MSPTTWPDGELALDAPPGLRLWLIDLLHPVDASSWQACTHDEHEKAGRFRFERDALRYRAAHAGMRRVLARELGIAARDVRWRTGTQGKPHLIGHEGWHFNLSHSGDWALLGLSRGAPIGVDIECPRSSADIALVAEHQFSPEEQAAFALCPPAGREAFFHRIWVCKEACLKALGCGLMVEPRRVVAPVLTRPRQAHDREQVSERAPDGQSHARADGWTDAWTQAIAHPEGASLALEVRGLVLPPETGAAQAAVARLPLATHPALAAKGW